MTRSRAAAVLALATAVALPACRSETPEAVRLALRVEGAALVVRVDNRTGAPLQVPSHFLDRSRPHELAFAVTTERGSAIAACRELEAPDGPGLQTVAAGGAARIDVPAQSVADAFCLEGGRAYRVQAVLVGGVQPGVPVAVTSNPIVITLQGPGIAE